MMASTWENLRPLLLNILYVVFCVISLAVWAGLMIKQGGASTWTFPETVAYTINVCSLIANCIATAVPIPDAIYGFGPEVDRSFEDFCKTEQGKKVVPLMDYIEGDKDYYHTATAATAVKDIKKVEMPIIIAQ